MKKLEKIAELTNFLFEIDDEIKSAKARKGYYFHLQLLTEVIRGQIEALDWVFDEDHPKECPCCGSDKVYLTSAIHCSHCAVTTEI